MVSAIKSPFVRSCYNYDTKEASDAVSIGSGGESLTVQSQSEDADINVMMKRYGILGKFPDNPFIPQYGDFTQVRDFRSALHAIQDASESFMLYPADFRARFDNDPQNFLTFCEDPDNIPEMKKLGLFKESANGVGTMVDRSSAQVGGSGAQAPRAASGSQDGAGVQQAAGQGGDGAAAVKA